VRCRKNFKTKKVERKIEGSEKMCECSTLILRRILICLKNNNTGICKTNIAIIMNSDCDSVNSGLRFLIQTGLVKSELVKTIKLYKLTRKGKQVHL